MPPKPTYKELENRIRYLEKAESEYRRVLNNLGKPKSDYRNILEAVNDGILIHEPQDGHILDANQRVLEMYGYTKEEITRLDLESLSDGATPFGPPEVKQHIEKATRGEEHPFELKARRKNGDFFWVEVNLKLTSLEGKECIVATTRDITAQKRVEKDLILQRDRLRHTIEGTNLGIWEWNIQTGKTIFNKRWADIIGYTLDELSPTSIDTWLKYTHPEDLEKSNSALEAHFKGESDYYTIECRMKHKDGHWVWVIDRGKVISWTADGKPLWMFGTHVDISNRKNTEEALRSEENKYKKILQTAKDGFWLVDVKGKILEINDAYCRMSGYSAAELLSMHIPELEGNMGVDEVAAKNEEIFRKGYDRFETKHRRKDGSLYDVEVSVQRLEIDDGKFVVFLRDITRQKETDKEKELLQAQLLQSQKMDSIGRLAGGVAHDFNNMLGVILGFGEMAMAQTPPGKKFHNALQEIMNAAQRSTEITRQLLAFARKQTVSPKTLDINKTISEMTKMLQRLIGENIDLAWSPGNAVWPVRMDPSQIDQLLANLCVNARDAIANVGKITIETGKTELDEAYCTHHIGFIPGEYVVLSVSDNGCGMDAETLDNIFDPFFTTKKNGKGTGLGLSTVYGIVKQNKGFINAYSEPGHGTTIKIYLPRFRAQKNVSSEEMMADPMERGYETILLVEDEPGILKMTTMMLEELGYTVAAAKTPDEAIRFAREHQGEIHLLLTDVVMPGMNGKDLAKNILSIHPDIRTMFMSGYTANVIAHHGVLYKGVNFLQKPFSMAQIGTKVREALDGDNA